MLDTPIRYLDRFNQFMSRWCGRGAMLMIMAMLALITVHVFSRYLFHYSFTWTEETSRFMMVWMTFLFFPTGHKQGLNVNVDFAVAWFKHTFAGRLLRLVLELLVMVLLIKCIQLSFGMIDRGMHTYSLALQVPMAWIYSILPVSFGLTFLCSLENVLRLLQALFNPQAQAQAADESSDALEAQEAA